MTCPQTQAIVYIAVCPDKPKGLGVLSADRVGSAIRVCRGGVMGRFVSALFVMVLAAHQSWAASLIKGSHGLPVVSVKLQSPGAIRYVAVDSCGRPVVEIEAEWMGQCAGGYVVVGTGRPPDREHQVLDWLGRECLPLPVQGTPVLSGAGLAWVTGEVFDLPQGRRIIQPAKYAVVMALATERMYIVRNRGLLNVVEDGLLLLGRDVRSVRLPGSGWILSQEEDGDHWVFRRRGMEPVGQFPAEVHNARVYPHYALVVLFLNADERHWAEVRSLRRPNDVKVESERIFTPLLTWPDVDDRYLVVDSGEGELRGYDMQSRTYCSTWSGDVLPNGGRLSGSVFCWEDPDGMRMIADVASGRAAVVDDGGILGGRLCPLADGELVGVRNDDYEYVQVCSVVDQGVNGLALVPIDLSSLLWEQAVP